MFKRLSDIVISSFAIVVLFIPFILIAGMIFIISSTPIIHWSSRVGINGNLFIMPKFRTMKTNTPQLATEKLSNPKQYLIPMGLFLRRTSLDEIPQFFSVLKGDMSLVGPRPALHNQYDIILKRKELGISVLKPGITGWAQINGRDKITLDEKIKLDHEYLKRKSTMLDFQIIIKTIVYVMKSKNIVH